MVRRCIDLIAPPPYPDRPTSFAVVLVDPANLPDEFFSNLDCFHPSVYGQQQVPHWLSSELMVLSDVNS